MKRAWMIPVFMLSLLTMSCALTRLIDNPQPTPLPPARPLQVVTEPVQVTATATAEPSLPPPDPTWTQRPAWDTPAPTATQAAPTQTPPTLTPTETAVDCPAYYDENFDSPTTCWNLETVYHITDIQNPDKLNWGLEGGEFKIHATANEELYLYFLNENQEYSDVIVEAEVLNHAPGTTSSGIVIACRVSDQGWVEVRQEPSGLFQIYQFDFSLRQQGKNPYVNLTAGGARSIRTGFDRVNTMTLACSVNELVYSLNGTEIWKGALQIPLKDGGVALGVTTGRGSYPTHIGFERFSVIEP